MRLTTEEYKLLERPRRTIEVDTYLHPAGDCSLNGITAQYKTLYLTSIDAEPFKSPYNDEERPLLILCCYDDVRGHSLYSHQTSRTSYIYARPLDSLQSGRWGMAGGNFVYTCDSRYKELVSHRYPIPVHDRFE